MPHVFGAQVGQPVKIVNNDPTLHNVHAVPKDNTEFNFGQPLKGMETTRMFEKPEVGVLFRCDVRLDGGLRRHRRASILRRNQARRQLRNKGPAGRNLHDRNVARAVRSADAGCDCRWHYGRKGGLRLQGELIACAAGPPLDVLGVPLSASRRAQVRTRPTLAPLVEAGLQTRLGRDVTRRAYASTELLLDGLLHLERRVGFVAAVAPVLE